MTVHYAGGKRLTGEPSELPKEGVLLIQDGKQRLHSADFYVYDPVLDDWGVCHCRCVAEEHVQKGRFVFSGQWVSKEEWRELWENV